MKAFVYKKKKKTECYLKSLSFLLIYYESLWAAAALRRKIVEHM